MERCWRWWGGGGGSGGPHFCSIHIHLVSTCSDAVENLFLPLISVLPLVWNLMMRGFHQQLQLSVEWSDITAASVLFTQLLKLDKLSLLACADGVKGWGGGGRWCKMWKSWQAVKNKGSSPVWCTSPHLLPHRYRRRRIPQTNWAQLC